MRSIINLVTLFFLLFSWDTFSSVGAVKNCAILFSQKRVTLPINVFHQKEYAATALRVMMEGSLNVSRTSVLGRRFIAPKEVKDSEIAKKAEDNFQKAAMFVLENFESLEIDLTTAVTLNKILTKDLVPEINRGKYDYRPYGLYIYKIDQFIGYAPEDFYIKWLSSTHAKNLMTTDPVKFAEIVHNTVIALDSFPDGNGRLSRLLADLILIKSNMAPAYYTSMNDYFNRGSARSEVSREVRQNYFYEIVIKGLHALGLDWNSYISAYHFEILKAD